MNIFAYLFIDLEKALTLKLCACMFKNLPDFLQLIIILCKLIIVNKVNNLQELKIAVKRLSKNLHYLHIICFSIVIRAAAFYI